MISKKKDLEAIDGWFMTIPTGIVDTRDDRTKEASSVDIVSFKLRKLSITQEIY